MIFSSQRFLQKTNKRILLYYYETSGRLVFVRFWRKLKTLKRHFEINWPPLVEIEWTQTQNYPIRFKIFEMVIQFYMNFWKIAIIPNLCNSDQILALLQMNWYAVYKKKTSSNRVSQIRKCLLHISWTNMHDIKINRFLRRK